MLAQALAHATGVPHAHSGDTLAALAGVAIVLIVALAPRLLRRLRGSAA